MVEARVDFETRSAVDLKKRGAYPYFECPHFRPLIMAYQIGTGLTRAWVWGEPCPPDLALHIKAGGIIRAWNAAFERQCFAWLTKHCGWPAVALTQFRCTMAEAAAMGLPRSLDAAGEALGLRVTKDRAGYGLIRKFSIPRKKAGETGVNFNQPEDYPKEFAAFVEYCIRDVETEAAAAARIVPLSAAEQSVWWLDQQINDRGIRVDRVSALAAIELAGKATAALNRQMVEVTSGMVRSCSNVGQLTAWVQDQGVEMSSAAKAEIEALLLADDLPERVRQAVSLRQEFAKSSVAKLQAMIDRASADGRVRGGYIYHGAGTGRWSHTGVQTGNMPRGRKLFSDAIEKGEITERDLYAAIRTGDPDWLEFTFGPDLGRPMWLLSDAIRGFLVADKGKELVVADYSSIEGRVAAWVAGETWKLDAYVANDEGRGAGLYELAAAGIYNVPVADVSKAQRQVGKVAELALQYQGGVGALASMAGAYGMKLNSAYEPVWESASADRRERAVERYEECVARNDSATSELGREGWLAAELIKVGWRETNPAIKASWKMLEATIKDAVSDPGRVYTVYNVAYVVKMGFLWCRLPSGRCLAYGAPRFSDVEAPWADKTVPPNQREKHQIVTALGVNSVTKTWERFGLYGGLAFENCLSAESEVLTLYGFRRITDIQPTDKLWDGLEWVSHDGVVCQGSDLTYDIAGVRMTKDHKVWTDDGWVCAKDADIHAVETASPDPEFDRAALRAAARDGVRWWGWQKELVVGPMRLRHNEVVCRFGAEERPRAELRLLSGRDPKDSCAQAWDVSARGVPGVVEYARALRTAGSSGVSALWRAWDNCLRAVANLFQFLGRHGAVVAEGPDVRTVEQQRGLLAGKLRMERSSRAGPQYPREQSHRHTERQDAPDRSVGDLGNQRDDALLSSWCGVADAHAVRPTGLGTEGVLEPVYDILNAGPRRRFTVRGRNGPIIVSNCVQAIARDCLAAGMLQAERAGYPVIGHVHDEIITEVPAGFGDVQAFEAEICKMPKWAAGLPLTASGFRAKRYRK